MSFERRDAIYLLVVGMLTGAGIICGWSAGPEGQKIAFACLGAACLVNLRWIIGELVKIARGAWPYGPKGRS